MVIYTYIEFMLLNKIIYEWVMDVDEIMNINTLSLYLIVNQVLVNELVMFGIFMKCF